jgi:glycosyltransferase involved in cell wall biosynthesis
LFAALTKLQQPFKLYIVGRGPLLPQLQAQVLALNLVDSVFFLGVCNDVERLMQQADAFVLSSAWEGFGLVIAEALACELPVVATDCGGPAEIVGKDKKAGFVVPPKNADALAAAMNEMMSLSNEQRADMGRYGREYMIARFSLAHVVTQWESLYLELLGNKSG